MVEKRNIIHLPNFKQLRGAWIVENPVREDASIVDRPPNEP